MVKSRKVKEEESHDPEAVINMAGKAGYVVESANALETLLSIADQTPATAKPPDADKFIAKVGGGNSHVDEDRLVRVETDKDGNIVIFKKGEFRMPNGDRYVGETVNDKRQGSGSYYFSNGDTYQGGFENGLFHGYGVMSKMPFYENRKHCVGRNYQGFWDKGSRSGHGRYKNGFGDYYDGNFKDDVYDGQGTMFFADGSRYIGEWKKGRFSGFGEHIFSNGSSTKAHYVNGLMHGQGLFRYGGQGGSYHGNWKFGRKDGVGKRTYSSGAEYQGEFVEDVISGKGVYKSAVGDLYVGNFRNNKFHGEGTLVLVTGDRYQGQFQRGQPAGIGRWDYERGGFYEGEFMALMRMGVPYKPKKKWVWDGDTEGGGIRAAKLKAEADEARRKHALLVEEERKEKRRLAKLSGNNEKNMSAEEVDKAAAEKKLKPRQTLPPRPPREKRLEDFHGPILVGSPLDAEYLKVAGDTPVTVMALADGLRHGRGVRVYGDGSRFEGEWYQGEQQGFGVYLGSGVTGVRYEGSWHEGKKHGSGVESYGNNDGMTYVCPLGNQHNGNARCFYDGDWRNGYYWGQGTFTCCDGRQYSGEWMKGKRHGKGRWIILPAALHYGAGIGDMAKLLGGDEEFGKSPKVSFSDQERMRVYEGIFVKNKRIGRGKCTFNNGDVVEGYFSSGRLDGEVKVTFSTGKVSYALYKLGVRKEFYKGEKLEKLIRRDQEEAKKRVDLIEKEHRQQKLLKRLNVMGVNTNARAMEMGEQLALMDGHKL
jgi:hypothetical protein